VLKRIDVAACALDRYEAVIGKARMDEVRALAAPLAGKRVAHINATAYGGGVSELLRSMVPLYRAFDIQADWLVISGTPEFFGVTKGFHNALQGARFDLTPEAKDLYLAQNRAVAEAFDEPYDYVMVHDPQPAPLRHLCRAAVGRWIWRCHIDTSQPNENVFAFLKPFLMEYDSRVFTMERFVPADLRSHAFQTISPGIDPASVKNLTIPAELCRELIRSTGVDPRKPLITQVSRFDPWKDPIGVIEAFRRIRERVPRVQLALLGQMALDDPQGWQMYDHILAETANDDDVFVLTNFTGIGNMEVNAFQTHSNVVLQKSLREGFGLVVSESLWKGTPVVAGRAGGIVLQMPPKVGGYLVESVAECVDRTVRLLENPVEARNLGAAGREYVREHFLITRVVADEFRLLSSLG
jgi:trehalose synthase